MLTFFRDSLIILLFCTSVYANEIYMDQIGNNVNIDIIQKGENNQIKGRTTTNSPISGSNNTLEINQGYEGNNLIQMDVDGNSNTVIVGQEKTYSSGLFGNDTNSYGNHTSNIDVDGDYNEVQIVQRNNNTSSAGHTSSAFIINGDNNSIQTLQTGTGSSNGHNSYVTVRNGRDGNTVDIFQNSDTADHKAVVSIYSNNNDIDIDQTGTTQNKTYILFSHHNTGPVDFTLSQNGGDTYGNPDTGSYATIGCQSYSGCTVTVTQ